MKPKQNNFFIALYGPTGVGKTELADQLANELPIEIINMDVGQLYVPLTIGTAKPDWRAATTSHHSFDILNEPRDYTVTEYRSTILHLFQEIWARNHIPVLVGGSGFYLKSLLFPPDIENRKSEIEENTQSARPEPVEGCEFPYGSTSSPRTVESVSVAFTHEPAEWSPRTGTALWQTLHSIDPIRAAAIHRHDEYRIKRALAIWQETGSLPSLVKPVFNPPSAGIIINLGRTRAELYNRINKRTLEMIAQGWVEEVKGLVDTNWQPFLQNKKLIGYNEIMNYMTGTDKTDQEWARTVAMIQQKTRNYAKRQITFSSMITRHLSAVIHPIYAIETVPFDLTLSESGLYIKKLICKIKGLAG